MIALGIDPGINGAIAAVCSRRGLLEVANLPTCSNGAGPDARVKRKVDGRALATLLAGWSTRHGFAGEHIVGAVERMQAFEASPVTLLSMGHSAGLCEALLLRHCETFVQPLPQQWKRRYGLGKDKAQSVEVARRTFGVVPARFRHDLAEAALIAHWALGSVNGPVAVAAEADCAF